MAKLKMTPQYGQTPILIGHPTVLAGALVDGKPDFAAVAWTGVACSIPPHLTIALQHHRHSLKGVKQNMAFSVIIPSAEQVKETDYCGLVSGAKADKVADCHFKVFYGELPGAPLIEDFPVSHACKVVQILDLGSHELIVGRIVETYVSEDCMVNGRFDPAKAEPFFFARKYYILGEAIGDPFRCGSDINHTKAEEGIKENERFRKRMEEQRRE